MALWVGTSGYNYPEWKGRFYPPTMPTTKMLPYYAEHFATVEINNTFYRMLNQKVLADWSAATPPSFKLTLKAPKRITHDARLEDCSDALKYFCDTARTLTGKLGVLLFQLPPYFKKNLATLENFLTDLPMDLRATFEFRHASWLDADVYACLRQRNLALCIADSEKFSTPPELTADYAYFRLRDEGYTPTEIAEWAHRIREMTTACKDVFVYFKHEEAGKGPQFARLFLTAFKAT